MSDSPRRFPTPLLLTAVMGVLILIALLTFTLIRSWDNAPDQSALLGKPAPNFSLPLLHDPSLQISNTDLAGAPYLLHVWGSWCAACATEQPVLTHFALSKRVRVIGYNWKDRREDALQWLEQLGNPYLAVVSDPEGKTAMDWGVTAAPTTFLIDGRGIVRWHHKGALNQQIIEHKLLPILADIEHSPTAAPALHQAP
ncbi:DsbE family thiol:disulfide interchange protein [Xylella fastidiosa]|uniref:DsbE family thiol:disulfide interchange protein n=1 Tax=Xylella fastidiosa TaxID=2371 RepID=A0ABC8AC18_XYLFS|nr:DsbE family thiol:disulfide interchange protein [Xylella fastidiosa]ALR03740.1 DsbE family thiol:disulfide interchange protein [Xylella fastidiosa]ALR05962.1 DsbE family thiol:disulfide interchange protein [Xylella fastidiosa]KXB20581.1 thiol:disulfide interchange protein [Xylella fastidiosa]OJZ72078.1 thiol:disulfide interchange protein [Xylella fastidiosa 6c]